MAQHWTVAGPKVLDVGSDEEMVRKLKVGLVAGHVDVVTHDDSPAARVEVHGVEGPPLEIGWDGSRLKISHVNDKGDGLWESVKKFRGGSQRVSARISISVPEQAELSISTVSAGAVIGGSRADVRANTVSGTITLDDIVGDVNTSTVSGDIECQNLTGDFSGNTVSGSLTAQASTLDKVGLHTVSGNVTLDLLDGSSQITSNSVSGDVMVRMPTGGGYDVSANTMSGHIVIDGHSIGKTKYGPGRSGKLSDGDGALKIHATSVSGDVVVLRATGSGRSPDDVDDQATERTESTGTRAWPTTPTDPASAPTEQLPTSPAVPPAPAAPPAPPAPPSPPTTQWNREVR